MQGRKERINNIYKEKNREEVKTIGENHTTGTKQDIKSRKERQNKYTDKINVSQLKHRNNIG